MSYDLGLRRYLLTFTYSYAGGTPNLWKDGSQLVILEPRTPDGPFSFVASEPYFGPSNGYDPAFPVNWISSNGTDLWMIWAANFAGCAKGLDCSGVYGFNYRELHLMLTASMPIYGKRRRRGPPRHRIPRLYVEVPRSPRLWVSDEPHVSD